MSFEKRFREFGEEKTTLSFPITPLNINPSLLNVTAFAGISQPDLELADIADKDMWVSKFKRLADDLEDVARQKATLAQNHKWRDIENLPRPDKLVFETWNAIPDTYMNMKKYAFGVLSIFGSTYAREQLFPTMNYIKNKHRSRLTDDSLRSCVKMKVKVSPLTPHDAAHTPKPKGEIRITAHGIFCFCLLYGLFKFSFLIYLKETFGHCYYFSRTKNVKICSLRIKFNFLCSTSWIS